MILPRNGTDTVQRGTARHVIAGLRSMAVAALARMYRRRERLFAFRLRRCGGRDVLEGVSRRYTAVALIGLAGEPGDVAAEVLGGRGLEEICGGLIEGVERSDDLGEVALIAWAARLLGHPDASAAIDRLRAMDPAGGSHPTVEVAWALSCLLASGKGVADEAMAGRIARRLLQSFRRKAGVFPHWPTGSRSSFLRSHVACFADFVYPIQALSHYYLATHDAEAAEAVRTCGRRMCRLQGPAGQWWWHFDVRTGSVVERFPVYAVHQDSMAPMALFALQEACGEDHRESIEKGLRWLVAAPEIAGSLMDADAGVIWRKVARHEPGRLVRGLQAAASRLHPSLRAPAMDWVFRPGWVDYESRPYHMGWILHAWPADRVGACESGLAARLATS